ncbi:MAG: hypothetical protein WCI62_01210, partial [Erysipelotrichaceae bacterium]
LPIVTNKYSSNDLDLDLPFIDIIPDDKLDDLEYIEQIIQHNRNKQFMKDDIRKYAVNHFSWEKLVGDYLQVLHPPDLRSYGFASTKYFSSSGNGNP